jgi:hypothetical protein
MAFDLEAFEKELTACLWDRLPAVNILMRLARGVAELAEDRDSLGRTMQALQSMVHDQGNALTQVLLERTP